MELLRLGAKVLAKYSCGGGDRERHCCCVCDVLWSATPCVRGCDQFGLAGLRADRVNGMCGICERGTVLHNNIVRCAAQHCATRPVLFEF